MQKSSKIVNIYFPMIAYNLPVFQISPFRVGVKKLKNRRIFQIFQSRIYVTFGYLVKIVNVNFQKL